MPTEPPESAPPPANDAPGMISLRDLAASKGRALNTVRAHWATTADFPAATGTGPDGENLYDQTDIDAWWDRHPELHAKTFTPTDPDRRISLRGFAALLGEHTRAVSQHGHTTGFPTPGQDERYRLGDLAHWWNNRATRGRYQRSPATGGRADQVTDLLRRAISDGRRLTPEQLTAELGISSVRVARGYLATATRRLVRELDLRTRADIAAHLPTGTDQSKAAAVKNMLSQSDAPSPVANLGGQLYYRPADADRVVRMITGHTAH